MVGKLAKLRAIVRGLLFGGCITGLTVGLNMIQLLSLLTLKAFPRETILFNSKLAGLVWYLLQYYFSKVQQGRVTISGDDIPTGENAVIIANHVCAADFFLLNALAQQKGMLSHCKYCLKKSLKYLPGFGWGMWLMGMIFLARNWDEDRATMERAFQLYKKRRIPVWLTMYVEGTRFTAGKQVQSKAFAEERGLPVLKHVLLPRVKGFVCTVQALKGSHVEYLCDLTFAYYSKLKGFGEYPSIFEILTSAEPIKDNYKFHVHARCYKIAELAESREELAEWILAQWVAKDKLLQEHQRDSFHEYNSVVDAPW